MDARSDVSLIVIVSDRVAEGKERPQRWFADLSSQGEFRSLQLLIVDESKEPSVPIIPEASKHEAHQEKLPVFCHSLAKAVNLSVHETLVFVDLALPLNPEANFSTERLDWVIGQSKPSTVLSYFESPTSSSKFKAVWIAFFRLLFRVLLRIRKSEFDHGFVVMPKQQAMQVFHAEASNHSNEIQVHGSSSSSFKKVWQLLALVKLNGFPVEEIESHRCELTESSFSPGTENGNVDNKVTIGNPPNPGRITNPFSKLRRSLQPHQNLIQFWWQQVMFPGSHENDPSLSKNPKAIVRLAMWCVLIIAASGLLFGSLSYPLFEPDEARNAQLAMNIIQSGDWLSLTLAGESYWDKPPLQIWAIATSYHYFGVNPMATRLPGTIASLLTILITFGWGRRLVGYRAAFVGAILLLLSCGFVLVGRYVTMDASLTLSVVAIWLLLIRSVQDQQSKSGWLWLALAGLVAGFGLLIKGPIVLVLTIPPLIGWVWLNGTTKLLREISWWKFFVPMLVVGTPWFLATSIVHPDFLTYFFWKHHVVRFADAFNHREPFWYYLPAILLAMFPVSYLLPSLVKFLMSRDAERLSRTASQGFLFLCAAWVLFFFSMAESKLPTYILPAFPPLCLLAGSMLDRKVFAGLISESALSSQSMPSEHSESANRLPLSTNPKRYRFLETLPQRATLGIAAICAGILLVVGFGLQGQPISVWWLGIALVALATLTICARRNERIPSIQAWVCLALVSFSFVLTGIQLLVPEIAELRSIHDASQELRSLPGNENLPVVFFEREDYGAEMVLPKFACYQFEDYEVSELCEFLEQHPRAIIVSSEALIKKLRQKLKLAITVEKSAAGRHLYMSYPR